MALQTSIAQYFNSRKRHAVDEIKKVSNSNKVLILDKNLTDVSVSKETAGEGSDLKRTLIYNDSPKILKPKKVVTSAPKLQKKTPKTLSSSKGKKEKAGHKQGDIRKSLLASFDATVHDAQSTVCQEKNASPGIIESPTVAQAEKVNVPFVIKGYLSPKKTSTDRGSKVSNLKDESSLSTPSSSKTKPSCEDNLKNIRNKLINSSRLDEIKKSLKKIQDGQVKLQEIGEKIHSKSPSLQKFRTVNIEITSPTKKIEQSGRVKVPDSPSLLRRAILMSPGKTLKGSNIPYVSPRKLFTETSPVKSYEKFSHLAEKEKASLVLPFKYRALAETFRAIDTVVSMLHNRSETILFSKLKASVQQMSKRNLTETHLGQILTVYPTAFTFQQEKIRQAPGHPDKYELSIKPVMETNNEADSDADKELMTPSVMLERKRKMYRALLDITKDHHQEFLKTLDPPMNLDKKKVTRWHPEFEVDSVPDIAVSPLPQAPNIEKFSTAKDVLSKARDMFIYNSRMERALEKNCNVAPEQYATPASAAIPALTSALKGIPKSLLEKVRAKQAAKASLLLTRDTEATKRRLEYSRLPEIARIVRNIFVAEKKIILAKDTLLTKLMDSYKEILKTSDMEHHLNLLMQSSPGWIDTLDSRGKAFLRMEKDVDIIEIQKNIDKLLNQL